MYLVVVCAGVAGLEIVFVADEGLFEWVESRRPDVGAGASG